MLVRNLLLALGVVCLLAGLALSIVWVGQMREATAQRPEAVHQAVLVAVRAMPSGTLLRPDDIGWKDVAAGGIRAGNLARGQISETEFVGAITRRDFASGEALIASDLLRPNERRFLAAVLKPGTRAASISVDAPQSAAGLILPGDQVDVILTQSFGDNVPDPARKTVGETILRNVRVIAVDQTLNNSAQAPAQRAALTAESRIPKTVTFEVTERQAERLFVAAQLGRLQLSVRPLEVGADAEPPRQGGPTWASDVSPAVIGLVRGPQQSGSTVDSAVRRAPVSTQ
jgi:pilus assembly protein CpaB